MDRSPSFLAAEAGDFPTLEQIATEGALEPNEALFGAAKAGMSP